MMDLALKDNDLAIKNGDFVFCRTDIEAIGQALSIRLKTLKGEWFLDINIGIPYFTEILGQKHNERFIRQLIVPAIESTPEVREVREVKDFVLEQRDNRNINISFTAVLHSGQNIKLNESIEV